MSKGPTQPLFEFAGRKQTLRQWAAETGLSYACVQSRFRCGIPLDRPLHSHPAGRSLKIRRRKHGGQCPDGRRFIASPILGASGQCISTAGLLSAWGSMAATALSKCGITIDMHTLPSMSWS